MQSNPWKMWNFFTVNNTQYTTFLALLLSLSPPSILYLFHLILCLCALYYATVSKLLWSFFKHTASYIQCKLSNPTPLYTPPDHMIPLKSDYPYCLNYLYETIHDNHPTVSLHWHKIFTKTNARLERFHPINLVQCSYHLSTIAQKHKL